jgi:predicted nucleotidyltransferase
MIPTPTKRVSIEQLKEAFASFEQIELALLFGSRATGTEHPFSDYDFAVVLRGNSTELPKLWIELANSLGIGDEQLDLIDLKRASQGLKKAIASNYILLKGNENELARLLECDC